MSDHPGYMNPGGAGLVRADAAAIPLGDSTVDLIVTSPPYFALRSYQDGGEHYDGQIGSEPSPTAFLEALWAVTSECWRVLKPEGSLWVNLGDKYAGSGGHNNGGIAKPDAKRKGWDGANNPMTTAANATRRSAPDRYNQASDGIRAKSLMGLPWRYAIGCIDGQADPEGQGWVLRSEVVWSKPNGLPESVTDRVRRSHEQWFHLTKQGRYFSAVDEIREPHTHTANGAVFGGKKAIGADAGLPNTYGQNTYDQLNPLGNLPGSVWTVPTEPLIVPEHLGVDHFAAFPTEWPRRIILGWSPSGICVECGEGRRPVVDKVKVGGRVAQVDSTSVRGGLSGGGFAKAGGLSGYTTDATITGHACGCPTTDAPTRPAVVLDPFGGTGTTAMVARALGRYGVCLDLSSDYLRLAEWRVFRSGGGDKAIRRTEASRQGALL